MALEFVTRLHDGTSAPANRAAAAISRLRQQMRALTQTTKEAGAAFDSSAARFRNANGQFVAGMDRSINAAGLLKGALLGLGAAAAGALVYGGAKLGGAIVESAAFRERSIGRLTALLGSREEAQREFTDAVKIAEKTPFDPDQVINGIAQLSIGFKDSTARRELFGAISDFVTVTGKGNEGLERAIAALNQIQSKGKLSQEELTGQLGELGLGSGIVYDALAKLLNVKGKDDEAKRQAVIKMISAGKVNAETGAFAIYQAMKQVAKSDRAGEVSEAGSKTIDGIISNIKGGLKTLLGMADTTSWAGMQSLRDLLSDIGAIFASDSKEGQGLVNVIRRIADTFGPVFKLMRADVASAGAALADTSSDSERFYQNLEQLWVGLYRVAQGFVVVGGYALDAVGAFVSFGEWIGETLARVYLFGESMENAGIAIVEGLINGIRAAASGAYEMAGELGQGVLDAVKRSLGIASPSRLMMEAGGHAAEGFEIGLGAGAGNVRAQAQEMAGAALTGAGGGRVGVAGGVSVEINLNIAAAGADPAAVAQEILPQVGAVARDAVEQVLERWAQEG